MKTPPEHSDKEMPVKDWIPHPPADPAEFLDGPEPTYATPEQMAEWEKGGRKKLGVPTEDAEPASSDGEGEG
jgi:hypothetical protein